VRDSDGSFGGRTEAENFIAREFRLLEDFVNEQITDMRSDIKTKLDALEARLQHYHTLREQIEREQAADKWTRPMTRALPPPAARRTPNAKSSGQKKDAPKQRQQPRRPK
jgi:hypothetical protein